MKSVLGYIRVSTDGQVGENKYGLDAQKNLLIEYAVAHDMQIVKWVSDEGESGAKERPGFDRIVYGDITNPPYEAVIVTKSDRVARDINVYYYYKMMLLKKNIELVSITEDFGAMGTFATMLEAFTICAAQMERENITKRTTAGRKVKSKTGGYSGGKPPFGYRAEKGKLIPDPDEAQAVRLAFKCKYDGETLVRTSIILNEAGYTNRSGELFSFGMIRNIWNHERFYKGEYKYGKEGQWVKGQHKPLISEEEFPTKEDIPKKRPRPERLRKIDMQKAEILKTLE